MNRVKNRAAFLKLLVAMNSQRIKSTEMLLHESLIKIDPKAAHQKIVNDRKKKREDRIFYDLTTIDPSYDGRRCQISEAKRPFLHAVSLVFEEQRAYWPLSDRQIIIGCSFEPVPEN